MRIAHEMPISMMEQNIDHFSNYCYALLHLMDTNKRYANIVHEYCNRGGFVILDNSAYELGGSLDNALLHKYVEELQPTEFILPDVIGNGKDTLKRTFKYLDEYPINVKKSNCIAVAQGATRNELIDCYKAFRDDSRIFKLGFPFCFPWAEWTPESQTNARIKLLEELTDNDTIDTFRPHHLLGTWQPREFTFYTDYRWIASIDTSNPIMWALDGNLYEAEGPLVKPKMTIDKALHMELCEIDLLKVDYNIRRFKGLCNG